MARDPGKGPSGIESEPAGREVLLRVLLVLLLAWAFVLRLWLGSSGLDGDRFWDERYGLENVRSILETGSLEPVNGFHPSLSYLPQAALLAAVDRLSTWMGSPSLDVLRHGTFTPTAYLLCRAGQALLGTLTLVWTFWIGRRLFGPAVALLGALLLAGVPWHVRQSAIYKPDVLVLLAILVAFLWALDAARRLDVGPFLRAGTGVGLALASKWNGAIAAVPLVLAGLAHVRRDRRALVFLALAGVAALGVFLLLNPYVLTDPEIYQRNVGRTLRDYARKGEAHGTGHLALAGHAVTSLVSPAFFGPVLGAVALLGYAGIAFQAFQLIRSRLALAEGLERTMLLFTPAAYVILYAAATTNPSPHNWLPLTPFLALSAAWALAGVWAFAGRRVPALRSRPAQSAAALALTALVAGSASAYVYRYRVPTTWEVAADRLRRELDLDLPARVVYAQATPGVQLKLKTGERQALVRTFGRTGAEVALDGADGALDRADAELLLGAPGDLSPWARRRIARLPSDRVAAIGPAPFRAQGPELLLLSHFWQEAAPPQPLGERRPGSRAFLVPATAPGELASIEVRPAGRPSKEGSFVARLGGEPLPLAWTDRGRRRQRFASERFRLAAPAVLRLDLAGQPPPRRVLLRRWSAPEEAAPGPPVDRRAAGG